MAERRQAESGETKGRGRSGQDEQEEARRILDRLQHEASVTDTLVQRGIARTAKHLSAQDIDKNDPVEVWSTRIGRSLGILITLAIIVWLIIYLLQG